MSMIIDGTNGLTFNNSSVQASAGVVLQVVQGTYSTQTSTTSSSFVTTGLSASITPKFSTSKILILVYMPAAIYNASNVAGSNIQVQRGGVAVGGASSAVGNQLYINTNPSNNSVVVSFSSLDSPATTSLTTYTVYMNAQYGTIYAQSNNLTSYIQLLEVSA